jgi:YidC/Oxa1 family membrane protein insertase
VGIWNTWLELIRGLLNSLSSEVGLGLGVVLATLLLRSAVLPISWSIAYRGCIRQKKMARLQPELQAFKDRYAKQPDLYLKQMQALYARHGLSFVDGKSLFGSFLQMPVLLGMFHALRNIGDGVSFLWVRNLFKPDLALALIAGITTALMMSANPDIPEQMRAIMILVPSIIAIVVALKFCSALSIYWVTSNCFSAIHTVAVHAIVERRIRRGALKI